MTTARTLTDPTKPIDEEHTVAGFAGITRIVFTVIHPAHGPGGRFDGRRPRLDRVAFTGRNRAERQNWPARPHRLGIVHGEIVDTDYRSAVSFHDPDGPRWSSSQRRPEGAEC